MGGPKRRAGAYRQSLQEKNPRSLMKSRPEGGQRGEGLPKTLGRDLPRRTRLGLIGQESWEGEGDGRWGGG